MHCSGVMKTTLKNLISYLAVTATLTLLSGSLGAQASIVKNEDIQSISPEGLPPLYQLEQAAFRHAGLDPELIRQWDKGAKWAAALPRVQLGWDRTSLTQNTAIIQDSISVTSAGITVGPESNRIDQDSRNNNDFEIKAIWSLNELIFNRDRLDISREARDLVLIRQRISEELNHSYYALKAQLLKMQLDPLLAHDPLEKLKTEQYIDKINSLTNGKLSQMLEEKNPFKTLSHSYGEQL